MAELPATFTVLQKRTEMSPSMLHTYLHDLADCGLVIQERNLYRFNDDALDPWMQHPKHEVRTFLAMLFKIPVEFRVKKHEMREKQIEKMSVGDALGYKEMFLKKKN